METAAKSVLGGDDRGCNVSLLFVLNQAGEVRARHVKGLANFSLKNLLAYVAAFRRIRNDAADVVVFSLWKTVPLLVLARLFTRARIVFFLHLEIDTHVVDRILTRLAVRCSHAVWADSEAALASRGVPRSKRSRVISFVTERLQPLTPPTLAPRFVSWGRLNTQKGVDRAIELIALLAKRGVDAMLHAYGRDDGAKASLVVLADRLGVGQRVFFPGVIAPKQRAQAAADETFFLQLSRYEGMCMGAVEGMQLGLVPVATPTGQMRHYVQPGVTGFLVDPDDLPATADALTALLADPAAYRALSEEARRHWLRAPLYADDLCQAAAELLAEASAGRA